MKEGSIVVLNCGGPLMTVELFGEDGIIHTVWFVDCRLCRDGFTKDQLILIRE